MICCLCRICMRSTHLIQEACARSCSICGSHAASRATAVDRTDQGSIYLIYVYYLSILSILPIHLIHLSSRRDLTVDHDDIGIDYLLEVWCIRSSTRPVSTVPGKRVVQHSGKKTDTYIFMCQECWSLLRNCIHVLWICVSGGELGPSLICFFDRYRETKR